MHQLKGSDRQGVHSQKFILVFTLDFYVYLPRGNILEGTNLQQQWTAAKRVVILPVY